MKLQTKHLIIILLGIEIISILFYQFDYFIDKYKSHFNDFDYQYKKLLFITIITIIVVFIDLFKRYWYVTILVIIFSLSLVSCSKKAIYNKTSIWSRDSLEIPEHIMYDEWQ